MWNLAHRMHVKEGNSTLQKNGRNPLFLIFHFLQDGEKKNLLCCNISSLGGQNKNKTNKTNQTTNKKAPHTIHPRYADQKKIHQYKIFWNIHFCKQRFSFSQACLQDFLPLANSNNWEVMVNKSIFKCTILKQKNVSLLSHKLHAVPPCCTSEWTQGTEQYSLKHAKLILLQNFVSASKKIDGECLQILFLWFLLVLHFPQQTVIAAELYFSSV